MRASTRVGVLREVSVAGLQVCLFVLLGFTLASLLYWLVYLHVTFRSIITVTDAILRRQANEYMEYIEDGEWIAVGFDGRPLYQPKSSISDKDIITNFKKKHFCKLPPLFGSADTPIKALGSSPPGVVKVQSAAKIRVEDRLATYLREIQTQRAQLLPRTPGALWQPLKNTTVLVKGYMDDFLKRVISNKIAKIVYLSWENSSVSSISITNKTTGTRSYSANSSTENLPVKSYYSWYGHDPLCHFLTTSKNTRSSREYWKTCTSDLKQTVAPRDIDHRFLNIRPWSILRDRKGIDASAPEYVTFMLLFQDGLVTSQGVVFTKEYKVIPFNRFNGDVHKGCAFNISDSQYSEELFVPAQIFSKHFYHKNIEVFPKLAIYLAFLKVNPRIKVHIGQAPMLPLWQAMLGLDRKRYLYGTVRAKVIYVPEPNVAGHTNPLPVQMLANLYRRKIKTMYGVNTIYDISKRNVVVLIKRSKFRMIKQNDEIKQYLQKTVKKFKLELAEFGDDPVMSYKNTMKLFYRAALVVGPHGAGLSNLLYCREGTFVVEALCEVPKSFLCYQSLAYALGYHYYGVPAKGHLCPRSLDMDVSHIRKVIDFIMPHVAKLAA